MPKPELSEDLTEGLRRLGVKTADEINWIPGMMSILREIINLNPEFPEAVQYSPKKLYTWLRDHGYSHEMAQLVALLFLPRRSRRLRK